MQIDTEHAALPTLSRNVGIDIYRAQVILLQSLVSIVLSYQVILTPETILVSAVKEILVLGLVSLIGAAFLLPIRLVESRPFTIVLLLIDTAVTSAIIYATDQSGSDLYLAYFLIILITAAVRIFKYKLWFSAGIAASYAGILYLKTGDDLFAEGHVIRISILLIMGVVYSVMSQTLEQERKDKQLLLDEIRDRCRAEKALRSSESLLRALNEIALSPAEWDLCLERILALGCRTFEMSAGMITRIATDTFEITHIAGSIPKLTRGAVAPLGGSYCEWTSRSRDPICFADPAASDWSLPSTDQLLSPKAYAGVSIIVNGSVQGTLCFVDVKPRLSAFAGYEKTFLKLAAQWIGHELERREAEAQLHKAREQAQAANRAKGDFLAIMSHEMRTPMNGIVGVADLLGDTHLTEEQQEYVGILRRSSSNLLALINDILDLSKVEAGQLHLEPVEFDLDEVIDKSGEIVALRAKDKGLRLVLSSAPDVPTRVVGDPDRLRQILLNLLTNAIKFTDRGRVELRVTIAHMEGHSATLQFAVSDTGIGIPSEKHGVIFDRFSQADSSMTRQYGGTGLGLAITKRLVEMMNGRIWLDSYLGKGSTFSFTARFSHAKAQPSRSYPHMRVLLVDYDTGDADLIREMLTSWGAHVAIAPSRIAAIQLLQQACESKQPFSHLFLALGDTTVNDSLDKRQLLTLCHSQHIPCLLGVASVQNPSISEIYQLGLGGYISEPFTRWKLMKALDNCASRIGQRQSIAPTASNNNHQHVGLVLIADDSADNRRLIESYVKHAGYELHQATNGRNAIDMFRRKPYDLVLLDLEMPVLDGLEAAKMMRTWERETQRTPVPIIALTAHAFKEQLDAAIAAGCSATLTKPVRKLTLLNVLKEWIPSQSSSDPKTLNSAA
ncbi:MAG TPA: ATP-binding protein [Nitrospira sp.]|nr:ATP-binding protein [Nitrospira sp.]